MWKLSSNTILTTFNMESRNKVPAFNGFCFKCSVPSIHTLRRQCISTLLAAFAQFGFPDPTLPFVRRGRTGNVWRSLPGRAERYCGSRCISEHLRNERVTGRSYGTGALLRSALTSLDGKCYATDWCGRNVGRKWGSGWPSFLMWLMMGRTYCAPEIRVESYEV